MALVLRAVPARARRLAQAVRPSHRRPVRARLAVGLAVVLQPRPHLRGDAARVPAARVGARALHLDRQRRSSVARRRGVARVAAARDDGVSRRLPHRAQRARVERDRRRLLGRDRRRSHLARREPVRPLPARGRSEEVRSRRHQRRGARPRTGERPLRDGEPARRHLRAGRLPRVHPRLPALRLEPQMGHAARRSTSRRSCST